MAKLVKNGKGWKLENNDQQKKRAADKFHFNHQLRTRMQVVESKKYKKPRYKKKYDEEDY